MKPFVDIRGSGENVTIITGDVGHASRWTSAGLIHGADDATLSNLTVENTNSSNALSAAIQNHRTSPIISHVTLSVHDAGNRIPVHNSSGASPMIMDSALRSAETGNGIYSYNNYHPTVLRSYARGRVYSQTNSPIQIEYSYIQTQSSHPTVTTDAYIAAATAHIFSSTLDGGTVTATISGGGAPGPLPKRAGVADEDNVFYASTCPKSAALIWERIH